MTPRAACPGVGKLSEEAEGGYSVVNEGARESNDEEHRQVRRQCRAHRPPTEENQEHLRTHLPYWSWCPHSVSGRGVRSQHHRKDPGEDQVDVATVALDCGFFQDMPGEESIPVLVRRDRETRMLSADAVLVKGVFFSSGQCNRSFEITRGLVWWFAGIKKLPYAAW